MGMDEWRFGVFGRVAWGLSIIDIYSSPLFFCLSYGRCWSDSLLLCYFAVLFC